MVVNQEKILADKVRSDFPILHRKVNGKPLVYFDNAEASQKPSVVINVLRDYYEQYNSSVHRSMHVLGKETTQGESIIPVVLAKSAIDFLSADRHPEEAAKIKMAIDTLASKVKGEAGCILLDRQGRIGWAYNSSDMACAYMTTEQKKVAFFTRK